MKTKLIAAALFCALALAGSTIGHYWPEKSALDGTWLPPNVELVK